jgi:hypothetical protein
VGAKTALGILSALPLRDLSIAIVTGDVTALSRAPGIGKKTAQRIVLELRDKVEQQEVSVKTPAAPAAAGVPAVDPQEYGKVPETEEHGRSDAKRQSSPLPQMPDQQEIAKQYQRNSQQTVTEYGKKFHRITPLVS